MNKEIKWGITTDGRITRCKSPEVGKGRCNHVLHSVNNESIEGFTKRASSEINKIKNREKINKEIRKSQAIKRVEIKRYREEMSLGDYFEDEFIERFNIKLNGLNIERASSEEDALFGTDFKLNKIPIDITLRDVSEKSNTKVLKNIKIPGYDEISFGIRYGNKKQKFKDPVLIVSIGNNGLESKKEVNIYLQGFRKTQIENLLNSFIDIYLDNTEE